MSYGLVFVIGLVASVSSCIAVTGGLLVAVAAKYNEVSRIAPRMAAVQAADLFQCRAIIPYGLLGGAIGALRSALAPTRPK